MNMMMVKRVVINGEKMMDDDEGMRYLHRHYLIQHHLNHLQSYH